LRTQSPAQLLQAVRWHIHLRAQSRTQPLQRVWRRKPLRAQSRTQPLQRVQRRKYLRAQSRTQPMYRLCRPTLVRTQPRTQPVRGLPETDGCGESSGGNGCGRVGWQYCPRGWSGLRKRGTIWVRCGVCWDAVIFLLVACKCVLLLFITVVSAQVDPPRWTESRTPASPPVSGVADPTVTDTHTTPSTPHPQPH
jgi:hypothetical protein